MGMYTYFIIDGTVKKEHREKMNSLYTDHNYFNNNETRSFKELVEDVSFDLLKAFSEGERADMIFYGCRNCDEPVCEWDKESGKLHLEIDIKNYPEDRRPKKSMELFEETIPELFEEGLSFQERYEEYHVFSKYELKNGELVLLNGKEVWDDIQNCI